MLEAKKILLRRNSRIILNHIDFSLEKGLTLIVGPNASGKSSLLKVLAGVYIPDEGGVFLNGSEITKLPPSERFKLGIVLAPERMKISLNLTVEENLSFSNIEKAYELFPELKKLRKRKGRDLSGGERQMVVLARALSTNGKYFLLDEPFQGLHHDLRHRILEILKEISNKAIAIASHDEIEELSRIANCVCVLVGGEVKFFGSREEGHKIISKMFL